MKRLVNLIIIVFTSITIYGQVQGIYGFNYKNSVQAELGGHGLFYSLNYERILINGNDFKTAGQLGVAYYPKSTGLRDIWMPIGINELFSFGNHHVETGLGFVLTREASRDIEYNATNWFWDGLLTGRLGYRYQKADGRLIIRASFTPFYELDLFDNHTIYADWLGRFHPSGGLSIGHGF